MGAARSASTNSTWTAFLKATTRDTVDAASDCSSQPWRPQSESKGTSKSKGNGKDSSKSSGNGKYNRSNTSTGKAKGKAAYANSNSRDWSKEDFGKRADSYEKKVEATSDSAKQEGYANSRDW